MRSTAGRKAEILKQEEPICPGLKGFWLHLRWKQDVSTLTGLWLCVPWFLSVPSFISPLTAVMSFCAACWELHSSEEALERAGSRTYLRFYFTKASQGHQTTGPWAILRAPKTYADRASRGGPPDLTCRPSILTEWCSLYRTPRGKMQTHILHTFWCH